MGEEVVLFVDDFPFSSSVSYCRICHEAESESFKSLEAPCACSGTVKFAHRNCIQRWCNEKGNTICEICLQEYKPGYTAPSKKSQLIGAAVSIRDSLEIPRSEVIIIGGMDEENEFHQCTSAHRGASRCRSLALTLTIVLLVKHIFAAISGEADDYPFTLVTILLLKVSGILLPMLVISKTITAFIKNARRLHRYQVSRAADDTSSSEEEYEEQPRNADL